MPSKRGRRGGRRVRRAQTAAAAHAPRSVNPYLAVQDALTEPARQRVLEWWEHTNPHQRGAHVADILDLLCECDAFVALTDPYWEMHGDRLADELGEAWHVVSPSATAAVILLGLAEATHFEECVEDVEAIEALAGLTDRIARAGAAGDRDTVSAPDANLLSAWLAPDGTLRVRHGAVELAVLAATGACDDCIHPLGDHDTATGACLRINPTFGPCPCRHTPPDVRAGQQRLCEERRQAGSAKPAGR